MKHFIKIADFNILPALLQLERHPELWNENRDRKDRKITAHSEMDDIWLRYRKRDELKQDSDFLAKDFYPVWYPAIDKLFELRSIIMPVMNLTRGTHLGGCLITKLPPSGRILPHQDFGWHPEFFETKVYVPLKSNSNCINYVEEEALNMKSGEAWIFNNQKIHSVENNSNDDRITLIISIHSD
jgi:hypothetical protein